MLQLTLPDYETAARARLSPDVAAYFLGAAGAGCSLARNLSDLAAVQLRPRVLCDLRGGHTRLTLLGREMAHPVLVAPMAYQALLHPDGETGTAAAATALAAGMVLSAQASQPMEHVRAAGPSCDWFQMYWQPRPQDNHTLADRARAAGFRALVLTVDAPVNGVRDQEIRAGFRLPDGIGAVNMAGMVQPRFAELAGDESLVFDRIAQVLPGWDDIARFCADAPLPVLLKGILHPDDARAALDCGAAGVIVSNHGGRVLDGAVSSITALPDVAAVIAKRIPVLMDGGIRRGADVFRALALGADAVLVGRPVACGLAVAGGQGAAHVLRLLRDELEVTMALTGCATLDQITPAHVRAPV